MVVSVGRCGKAPMAQFVMRFCNSLMCVDEMKQRLAM